MEPATTLRSPCAQTPSGLINNVRDQSNAVCSGGSSRRETRGRGRMQQDEVRRNPPTDGSVGTSEQANAAVLSTRLVPAEPFGRPASPQGAAPMQSDGPTPVARRSAPGSAGFDAVDRFGPQQHDRPRHFSPHRQSAAWAGSCSVSVEAERFVAAAVAAETWPTTSSIASRSTRQSGRIG